MLLTTDLSVIKKNIERIKAVLPKGTAFICMVKADAYNHGVAAVATYVENLVDGFGVATNEEGKFLRKLGIKKRILVAMSDVSKPYDYKRYSLIPMVGNFEILQSIERKTQIDIKFDTGMHRNGFYIEEADQIIKIIKEKKLKLRALCTHFASTEQVHNQMIRFRSAYSRFASEFRGLKKHYAASGAVTIKGLELGDEVRIGLAVYGYSAGLEVEPALRVSCKITGIKVIKKGDFVGYNGDFCANKTMTVGLADAGYYDGIRRDMQGGYVLLNNRLCQIIGRINMDSIVIDISECDAKIGDEVVIIDKSQDAKYWADRQNTIEYEILTQFKGIRISRKFMV